MAKIWEEMTDGEKLDALHADVQALLVSVNPGLAGHTPLEERVTGIEATLQYMADNIAQMRHILRLT